MHSLVREPIGMYKIASLSHVIRDGTRYVYCMNIAGTRSSILIDLRVPGTVLVLPPSQNSCPVNKIKGVLIGCLLVILP